MYIFHVLLVCVFLLVPGAAGAARLELTDEEKAWLNAHRDSLVLGFDWKYPPLEFLDSDGAYQGMSADLISTIEHRLGIRFRKQSFRDWSKVLDGLRDGDIALAPAIVSTAERREYALFTPPYAEIPLVIITPRSVAGHMTLEDLTGRRVAVVRDYASADMIRRLSAGRFELVEVDNIQTGLRDVSFGMVDAVVESVAVAAWFIEKEGLANLRVAGSLGVTDNLSMGISQKYPLLASAVAKALDSIQPQEMRAVTQRWIKLEVSLLNPEVLLGLKVAGGIGVVLLILLSALSWVLHRRLKEKITALEQAKSDLADQVGRFRLALEATNAGSWEFYPTEEREEHSQEWYTMLGHKPQYGSRTLDSWREMVHPDDRDQAVDIFRNYIRAGGQGVYEAEYRMRAGDGSWRWVLGKGRAVAWNEAGQPTRIIGLNLDIQQMKNTQAALRKSQEMFVRLFQLSPDMIALARQDDGVLLEINEAFSRFTGLSRDEALGRRTLELGIFRDPTQRNEFAATLMRDGMVESFEFDITHRDGRVLKCSASARLLDVDGISCILSITRDITHIRAMQDMMIQSEKMLSLGGIAAGIAHEINNPLGIILQAAQTINLRLAPGHAKNQEAARNLNLDLETVEAYLKARKVDEFLMDIEKAGIRAAGIVRHMLDFSRKSESRRSQCDIPTIIGQALGLAASDYDLKKNYDFKSVAISQEFEANLPTISCTETEIEQVFLNLFRNAAQAMAEARTPSPAIHVMATGTPQGVRVEIEDNGPGIPEEYRTRVFEPFFTTKEPGAGTGLGLSVSYFIVTKGHGGQMRVAPSAQGGTRFTIDLPCEGASPRA